MPILSWFRDNTNNLAVGVLSGVIAGLILYVVFQLPIFQASTVPPSSAGTIESSSLVGQPQLPLLDLSGPPVCSDRLLGFQTGADRQTAPQCFSSGHLTFLDRILFEGYEPQEDPNPKGALDAHLVTEHPVAPVDDSQAGSVEIDWSMISPEDDLGGSEVASALDESIVLSEWPDPPQMVFAASTVPYLGSLPEVNDSIRVVVHTPPSPARRIELPPIPEKVRLAYRGRRLSFLVSVSIEGKATVVTGETLGWPRWIVEPAKRQLESVMWNPAARADGTVFEATVLVTFEFDWTEDPFAHVDASEQVP